MSVSGKISLLMGSVKAVEDSQSGEIQVHLAMARLHLEMAQKSALADELEKADQKFWAGGRVRTAGAR